MLRKRVRIQYRPAVGLSITGKPAPKRLSTAALSTRGNSSTLVVPFLKYWVSVSGTCDANPLYFIKKKKNFFEF